MAGLLLDELKRIVAYDVSTGVFTWKVKTCRKTSVGAVCGCKDASGRVYIRINKKLYLSHRLAWFYVNGEFPNKFIDHINGNCSDNRIDNLREATHGENMQNLRKARSDSNSKLIGAMPDKKKWSSSIKLNHKKVYLGSFETKEDAHLAYLNAKRTMHPFCTI